MQNFTLWSAAAVRTQLDNWPKAWFEHGAWEIFGDQAWDRAPASLRVPCGCLLKILVAGCGLARR